MNLLTLGSVHGDRYRIESLLGRGAQAEVYLVHDLLEARDKVAKLVTRIGDEHLSANSWGHKTPRARAALLEQLSRTLSSELVGRDLRSPFVCRLHEVLDDGFELAAFSPACRAPVLLMESLGAAATLEGFRRRTHEESLWLLACIAEGIAACHEASPVIVHRDIAPDNILVLDGRGAAPGGECRLVPVLIDFAGARTQSGGATQWMGKPEYAPPDVRVVDGRLSIDPGWDVWSLAVLICFELLGRFPFRAADYRLFDDDGRQIRELAARGEVLCAAVPELGGLPDTLRPLVARSFDPDSTQRPTARALAGALHAERIWLVSGLAQRAADLLRREQSAVVRRADTSGAADRGALSDDAPLIAPTATPSARRDRDGSAASGAVLESAKPGARRATVLIVVCVALAAGVGLVGLANSENPAEHQNGALVEQPPVHEPADASTAKNPSKAEPVGGDAAAVEDASAPSANALPPYHMERVKKGTVILLPSVDEGVKKGYLLEDSEGNIAPGHGLDWVSPSSVDLEKPVRVHRPR